MNRVSILFARLSKLCTVCVVLGLFFAVISACNSNEQLYNPPPIDSSQKGQPKLDSQLNQLVLAQERGEAESLAEQLKIKLVEDKVRVIIECLPGTLDAVAKAVSGLGATIETSYNDLLQVVAPINILAALADEDDVRLIRLPLPIEPAFEGNIKIR